jgi:hypothetical protein
VTVSFSGMTDIAPSMKLLKSQAYRNRDKINEWMSDTKGNILKQVYQSAIMISSQAICMNTTTRNMSVTRFGLAVLVPVFERSLFFVDNFI